jgi:hypothetical protein
MDGLRGLGIGAVLYQPGAQPEVLVLSKRYDPVSLAQAETLKQQFNTRVVLDLCDNHFHVNDGSPEAVQRAAKLDAAVASVDQVISSTAYLAEIIRARPQMNAPVSVVEDLVEYPRDAHIIEKLRHPRRHLEFKRLRAWLQQTTPDRRHRLVWFGNHGGGFADSGMNDLRRIQPILERVRQHVPISLTVISNSSEKYEALVRDWTLPTYYLEWNETFISQALRLHGISVIPISSNPFTLAKSPNRVETSLVHGLGVVADRIPSYDKYHASAYLDDWQTGMLELLRGEGTKQSLLPLDFRHQNEAVIALWRDVLQGSIAPRSP